MRRSRLKNIINKSKEMNQPVGSAFDKFKKSLPKDILIGDDYRLEVAWKLYGLPQDYEHALWEGLIQPINEAEFKLPSIGYNEETDEYEYLNKGKDNETVAKDIRVWDNDVIPLVQELKLGGYVRTFNKEKDCWTYTKNLQKENTLDLNQVNILKELSKELINSFLKGGNFKIIPYLEWKKGIDFEISDDYDLETAYNELPLEQLENWRKSKGLSHLSSKYKKDNHPTYSDPGYGWFGSDLVGWTFYPSPRQMLNRSFDEYVNYWKKAEPYSTLNYGGRTYVNTPIAYQKQGGQMSVIPEGALHARKNDMELAKEGMVTHKGVPVVDNEGELQAEIERNEIIYSKSTTDVIEKAYNEYSKESTTETRKDELAIKIGKFLVKEILENTDDRTGLILEVAEKNNLEYHK